MYLFKKIVFLGLLILPLGLLGLFAGLLFVGGSNHSGFNFAFSSYILFSIGLAEIYFYLKTRSKNYAFLAVFSIATGLLFLYADYANIMVNYETWLKRGMPE